jgi:L-aminopeptidase/D-esterase-like protein
MQANLDATAAPRPSLTDVEGILVGHYTLKERPTGCTVITSRTPLIAGVDVRGGAPGTRETDLLRAESTVPAVNAVFLSGGSAFGLDAGTGVAAWLKEHGIGYRAAAYTVPIVCGAILFDLQLGDSELHPDARAGYAAADNAGSDPVAEGNVGAGAGCTVGKLFGFEKAMRGGLGSWSWRGPDGLCVGAIAAVNCAGDVWDPALGNIVAGARRKDDGEYLDCLALIRSGVQPRDPLGQNTVIGVVATNATLDKPSCIKVAQMAQDAISRCIYPAHTPFDGDTIFALATGRHPVESSPLQTGIIGALAADVFAVAILRGVMRREHDRGGLQTAPCAGIPQPGV